MTIPQRSDKNASGRQVPVRRLKLVRVGSRDGLGEGTYAPAAPIYRNADWLGVLPLRAGTKFPPPPGFSGEDGEDPDDDQIEEWRADPDYADGNTALRMPPWLVGLDIDHYQKDGKLKPGGDTLAWMQEQWGPLPDTWISTARRHDGDMVSGIRFYRIPSGLILCNPSHDDGQDPGVEIIQHHHRYAVVWPSINPETNTRYCWYTPDGELANRVPRPDECAELPR
jgi:hypothetical protein